jgi:glucose-1-phosphate thymidylyltransferase
MLAGKTGSRLLPTLKSVNTYLLPIFHKPVIYHPVFTLMAAGIQDILLLANSNSISTYSALLDDSSECRIDVNCKAQEKSIRIADAFIVG